jgi:hypothetical protein
MRKFIFILLAGTMLFSAYALAEASNTTTKTIKARKCLFPKTRKRAPDWVCHPPNEQLTFTAVGTFAKSKAGIDFIEQMAAADARAKLARKMNDSISHKIDSNNGSANNTDKALIEQITCTSLEGTKILNKAYAPHGRVYVLIGLDEEGTQKLFDSVSADYQKQKSN